MNFCGKCGAKLMDGNAFCTNCGAKVSDYEVKSNAAQPSGAQPDYKQGNMQKALELEYKPEYQGVVPQNSMNEIDAKKTKDKQPNKVNVKGGNFSGRKWFLKIPYKTYETNVEFNDDFMLCKQGSGFVRIRSRVPLKLEYGNIYAIDVKKKYSIPNTVASVFFIIVAFAIRKWIIILPALLLLWIGKTCTVVIHNQNGKYEIPVEFMADAKDLKNRIVTAQSQAMRR